MARWDCYISESSCICLFVFCVFGLFCNVLAVSLYSSDPHSWSWRAAGCASFCCCLARNCVINCFNWSINSTHLVSCIWIGADNKAKTKTSTPCGSPGPGVRITALFCIVWVSSECLHVIWAQTLPESVSHISVISGSVTVSVNLPSLLVFWDSHCYLICIIINSPVLCRS